MIRGRRRVRLNDAYVRALEDAGVLPVIVPPLADADDVARLLARVDGLVLTGGEDVSPSCYGAEPHAALGATNQARDRSELALVVSARDRVLPTLAICRGIQVLNVALGGTLVQDIPSESPEALPHESGAERDARTHRVAIVAGSRLAAAIASDAPRVNSFHHQSIARVAPSLRVVAAAPDGVIEGVESTDRWWVLGVQWHPEELTQTAEPWDRNLFRRFAEACGA
jgi:putative glutamine amidotransferase